jgi:Tfp pilus assembly protein PilN
MLRVNVATRPFYNERGVHLLLGAVGLLLLGVTALNGLTFRQLSQRERELTARTSQQEARARDLRREAAALRSSVDQQELDQVLVAARQANGLIELRTFSWTELFNQLEETLPEDVMLTAVRPAVEQGRVMLTLGVVGRQVDAIDTFMIRLEDTGAFQGVLSRDERLRDDGAYEATVVGYYVPSPPARAAAARPDAGVRQ